MIDKDDNFSMMQMFIDQLMSEDESLGIPKDQTGFNRRSVPAVEYLKKCKGEMERYLDAAEIYCDDKKCIEKECSFMKNGECILPKLRELLQYQ